MLPAAATLLPRRCVAMPPPPLIFFAADFSPAITCPLCCRHFLPPFSLSYAFTLDLPLRRYAAALRDCRFVF